MSIKIWIRVGWVVLGLFFALFFAESLWGWETGNVRWACLLFAFYVVGRRDQHRKGATWKPSP